MPYACLPDRRLGGLFIPRRSLGLTFERSCGGFGELGPIFDRLDMVIVFLVSIYVQDTDQFNVCRSDASGRCIDDQK
jgi:hypothetical protein